MADQLDFYLNLADREFEKFYTEQTAAEIEKFSHKTNRLLPFVIALIIVHCSTVILGGFHEQLKTTYPHLLPCLFTLTICMWILVLLLSFFIRPSTRLKLYPLLAEALHYNYREIDSKDAYPAGIRTALRKGFLPRFEIQHAFWTEQDGLVLDFWQADWVVKGGKDEPDIPYYGLIFSCHLRTPLKGTTILVSDSLSAKYTGKVGGFSRVKLEWIEFEKTFDLFSTDEREARFVLAPDTMETLYDFYHKIRNRSMCFIFEEDTFSCFYSLGEKGNLYNKKNIKELFLHLYVLKYFPQLLHYKMLASAWQEENYVQQRRDEHHTYQVQQALPNKPDTQGITPLINSILANDLDAFRLHLSDPYADANQRYAHNGNTLLHLAVLNNRVEMVKLLLSLPDIQTNTANNEGQTPLDMARARGYQEIITLLEFHNR